MKSHSIARAVCLVLFLSAGLAFAQDWTLKDSGVGLVVQDESYDTQLKIAERGTSWDLKDLYENGALAGKYRGNQAFAAWIQGPPTDQFKNQYGTPVWNYKYRLTYPDGKTYEAGPYGFYAPGFATTTIGVGGYTSGSWKIDWFIVHRDTGQARLVATNEFTTTWGKPAAGTGPGWQLKDSGVGLIIQDESYDTQLKIAERRSSWNLKELYEGGALAGKYRGNQAFAAWIQGPPTDQFKNQYGTPVWNYKYRLTYPDGKAYEAGPYGFYAPGFATTTIGVGGYTSGSWKIDWFIVHRETGEARQVGTTEFTTTW